MCCIMRDLPYFPDAKKPHAIYEPFPHRMKGLEVLHLGHYLLDLVFLPRKALIFFQPKLPSK